MRIEYSRQFRKEFKKITPNIKEAFTERLRIFCHDQFHPLLHNHRLTGEYAGCRSINITGDWRAVYEESEDGATALFSTIGTHSQLYEK